MSFFSLTLRIALCFASAFVPLSGWDQPLWDVLLRLKGPNLAPTSIVLLQLSSEEPPPSLTQKLAQESPKLAIFYSEDALREDTTPDSDCTVRHAHLEGGGLPSPTLLSYHRLVGTKLQPALSFPVAFDFRGPAGSYPTLTEAEALKQAPGFFHEKILMMGIERGVSFYARTPHGLMSPLEIQANILESLWQNRFFSVTPMWVSVLFSLFTAGIAVGVLLYLPLSTAWVALLGLAFIWLGIGWIALAKWKIAIALANPLFTLACAHLLLLGFKVKKQEEDFWRTKRESEYARELDEFKNNFVSLFSHDLKTPIARIKAIVQMGLSEDEGFSPRSQEALKNIDRASDDLGRLIGDILKVTKMESMSLEIQRDPVDINRLVDLAVARLKFSAEEKNIRFVLDLEPLFPIEGDPQLIQEIILNLIENAVKYGRNGTEVLIRTAEEPGRVRVLVQDQGIGIDPEDLPRVTGKFYRSKLAAKTSSGTGLGLYLAKYFVELHQGHLDIQSVPGKGTTVSFWLPSPP